MSQIRVLIADDHRLFREGLRQICEILGGFQVIGEAENGPEAVALAQKLNPDVILMDINMPGLNGIQATQRITEQGLPTRIIILTMHRKEHHIFEAVKAGARGYLLKNIGGYELIDAIKAVHRGEALIDPSVAIKLLEEFRRLSEGQAMPGQASELTPAEMDVLCLVAQGKDNKTIAEQLSLSESTIANRLREIYQKLDVSNRTQATLVALRQGWAKLEPEQTDDAV